MSRLRSGRRMVVLAVCCVLVLMVPYAAPVAAQDAPTSEGDALTMEEAERVVYGLSDQLNAGDIDGALALLAEDVVWQTRTEQQVEQRLTTLDEVRADMQFFTGDVGCTTLTQIQRIEGNQVHTVGGWTCYPPGEPVWRAVVTEIYTIEDGLLTGLDTLVLPATILEWDIQTAMLEQVKELSRAVNRGDMASAGELLGQDVSLTVQFDPVTGARRSVQGREEVLAVLSEWDAAGVSYLPTGRAYKGARVLVEGALRWPAWNAAVGVPLLTEDVMAFEEGKIVTIEIKPTLEMVGATRAFLASEGETVMQGAAGSSASLTMEEAERVIYGVRDALYENDLDAAMSFFADDVRYLSHSEISEGSPSETKYPVQQAYRRLLIYGCRPLTAITGIDGNTVQVVESWTCIPQQYGFSTILDVVQATIESGLIVAYDELVFDANEERWAAEELLQREYERFAAALRRGDLVALEAMLAEDVELSLSYDPVTGAQVETSGREAVMAVAESWSEADVGYSGVGWAENGTTIMAYGRLRWPEWTEVMGVDLRTEDEITFKDGKIRVISIGASAEMMRAYLQRQQAPSD